MSKLTVYTVLYQEPVMGGIPAWPKKWAAWPRVSHPYVNRDDAEKHRVRLISSGVTDAEHSHLIKQKLKGLHSITECYSVTKCLGYTIASYK